MPADTARVIFAGGGTGGHLFPALAIADRLAELLREKIAVDIRFVGTRRGLEYRMRDSLGYPLHLITVRGLAREFTVRNLFVPILIVTALIQSLLLLRRFPPDIVVGTGGYVSWPVLRIAAFKNVVTLLQEQNSFPGITTRRLARHAGKIYLGFAKAAEFLGSNGRISVTGNPVRRSVLNGNRSEAVRHFGLHPDKTTILVLGGSQGALALNRAVMHSLEKADLPEGYQLLWQTGKRDYKDVAAFAGRKAADCALFPFAERMDLVYAAADLVIGRAGAVTLAELMANGIPAMLIPYPFAAGDHQKKNAADLVNRGMARLIDQKDLEQFDLLAEGVSWHGSAQFQQVKRALDNERRNKKPAVDVIAEDIAGMIYELKKTGR
jgi:UDP-N-acetylglucosamine--N-acetylmuramyl-(pentapeptide) pyrophosphoryl-undecaprenol N-acetylglucosamine transferase